MWSFSDLTASIQLLISVSWQKYTLYCIVFLLICSEVPKNPLLQLCEEDVTIKRYIKQLNRHTNFKWFAVMNLVQVRFDLHITIPANWLRRSHMMEYHWGYCKLEYCWGYFEGTLQLLHGWYPCHSCSEESECVSVCIGHKSWEACIKTKLNGCRNWKHKLLSFHGID